jgi:transposase
MRKIKEVLRLRFDLGLTQDQIARSCNIAQATVHRYLERAAAAGLSWPLPAGCDDRQLEQLMFPTTPGWEPRAVRPIPDLAAVHQQLQASKHVTLQLLWEEYRENNPAGYGYSRFCELYEVWRRQQNVVLRQEHRAGEKMFVDWAGATIPVFDRDTGDCQPACLFVAVLGASSYTFAYATPSQEMAHWIDGHVRAFEFFAGTPKLVIPDNTRTGVDRSCRYEPDLNRTYHEMALHYAWPFCRHVHTSRGTRPRLRARF